MISENCEEKNVSQFHEKICSHLQIYLQALVIDFGFKSDKMELLCDNQRGLEKTKYVILRSRKLWIKLKPQIASYSFLTIYLI